MRKSTLALATVALVAAGGPVFAMYETGGITGIDPVKRIITLNSSITYPVAPKVDMSGLAINDHIRFDTETRNGRTVITKIIKGY